MREAWNLGSVGVVSLVEYGSMSLHTYRCEPAWLDVCSHASLWWTDHQKRGFYAAAVQAYHVERSDFSNRRMWSLSKVASGTRTGTLLMYNAARDCCIHVDGGTFSSFEIGWLEGRRAFAHLYQVKWDDLASHKPAPTALLLDDVSRRMRAARRSLLLTPIMSPPLSSSPSTARKPLPFWR